MGWKLSRYQRYVMLNRLLPAIGCGSTIEMGLFGGNFLNDTFNLHIHQWWWISMIGLLGVAALAPRMLPFGAVDVGPRLGLPVLPRLPVLLHTRVKADRPRDALAALSAAFRSAVRG